MFSNLSDRERSILKILIDHYISTAEPVASRVIAKRHNLNLSSASIRNTIKDLEEMGLVKQPHTSAGRVPTNEGYRLYVDYLLRPEHLTESEIDRINKNIKKDLSGIDQILEQTSRVLGDVSLQLGVTIAPRFESGVITRLELMPVAENRVLVVMALKSGLAKTILLEVETRLKEIELRETASILNERLCGLSLGELQTTLKKRLAESTKGDPRLIKLFIESSAELLNFSSESNIHWGGTRNILNQPEFSDSEKIRELISLIEERQIVRDLVARAGITEGITITIGAEGQSEDNESVQSAQLSMLSSTYSAGKFKGVLGIIGPTRMPYSKLMGIVDFTAKRLSRILSE